MSIRPTAILLVCALLGAYAGLFFSLNKTLLIISLLLSAVLILVLGNHLARIGLALLFTFLLSAFASFVEKTHYQSVVNALPRDVAIFEAVIEDIWINNDSSKQGIINISHIIFAAHQKRSLKAKAQIKLVDGAASVPLQSGSIVRLKAKPGFFEHALRERSFDPYLFSLSNGLHASMVIKNPLFIEPIGSKKYLINIWPQLRNNLRSSIMNAVSPYEASLLLALIIGDRSLFDDEQKAIYKGIGAEHLLAVSGLQVTLISALFYFALLFLLSIFLIKRLRPHIKNIAFIITTLIILLFVAMCGFPFSAVRAGLMAIFLLLPGIVGRKVDILDAFLASALFIILARSLAVIDLGFLLSYSAVFGLILSNRYLSERLTTNAAFTWLIRLIISTMAAFLATLPVIAFFFGSFAEKSILCNLILIPLAALLQTPAIILGILGSLVNSSSIITVAAFFANIIEIIAERLFAILGGIHYLPELSQINLFFIASGLFLIFLSALKKSLPMSIVSLFIIIAFSLPLAFNNKNQLLITVMAIGQGDATLFEFANGQTMLIDAGGNASSDFDPGEKIIWPLLQKKGIDRLDVLAISHPDPDHILGAFYLLEHLAVQEIWHSGINESHALLTKFLHLAHKKNISIKKAYNLLGSHSFGDAQVEVLAPHSDDKNGYYSELSTNDNSLVMRILFKGQSALWTGDIEYFGEALLLSDSLDLKASILKAPHHGSNTSSSLALIQAVKPDHVIFSTGPNNRYHFPHEEVVNRYKELGVRTWDTATHGEIQIALKKDQVVVKPFTKASLN